jgi:uncharacterized short protein YbdD (DUF466 family)
MNRPFRHEQGRAPEAAVPIANPCATPRRRLLDRVRAARQAWLQVFGIPDYERYLAHLQAHHPGAPMPSRREFYQKAIDRKYSHNGPRCC